MAGSPQRHRNDPQVLRALGSPVRQDILEELARGPATSAMLARRFGSNTGVMSYQLRELAKVGLIETDREEGRARYWRLSRVDVRFDDPQSSPHPRLASAAIDQSLARHIQSVSGYLHRTDLSRRWRNAALFSESAMSLTAAQLAEFAADYLALLRRWHERVPTSGRHRTRPIRLALFAYPDDDPEKG
jgi:DNA-binding transcriptional ArsR family regulator